MTQFTDEELMQKVQAGYMVRTRADSGTEEARNDDTQRRDQAFTSGAQVVTTDYYPGRNPFGTDYEVSFPGATFVRLNPTLPQPVPSSP